MPSCIGSGLFVLMTSQMVGCSSSVEARPALRAPAAETAPAIGAHSATSAPTTDDPPPPPASDPKTGEVPRGLPELKIELSGLHIGGGPNDPAAKRPFIETLEGGFDAMRACYTEVEAPEKGGTFGVDLRVERQGGHPTLQSVRTVMKGERFKACLERVFQGLEFGRLATGPTILSVSVRFSLGP